MHLKTDTSQEAHFAKVPTISHSRNGFSIAEKHVTTIQFDYLYPLYWKYIYPGDTVNMATQYLARLQTQIAPLYDDLYIDIHSWFVPMRLIQTNWARYQFNAQPAGPTQDNSALTSPRITLSGLGAGGFVAKTLYDYLGFPTEINLAADTININNYLARSYNLIWNENYRDQNLQTPVIVDLDDGPDNPADYVLLKRGRRHDRFTSCLTAAQKGTPISLPLGTTAPILMTTPPYAVTAKVRDSNGALVTAATGPQTNSGAGAWVQTSGGAASYYDPAGSLYADLATATAATLNQVRSSYAIQHLLEADARGGTRDVEAIANRWGVQVPDYRLQRPEYLGGSTQTLDGHIVPQTSETVGSSYQAGLKQFSQGMGGLSVRHSFVEHGVLMILVSCRSNLTYQQGLLRELSYRTRYDWYQPEFANIGEVAVLNKEIMLQGNGSDNNTFGFQEYGYELRYSMNRVSGEMRSNYATPLDSRHMALDFAALPTLGSAFVQSTTPLSRNITIATSVADPLQLNCLTTGLIARTLPMYSIPGLQRL